MDACLVTLQPLNTGNQHASANIPLHANAWHSTQHEGASMSQITCGLERFFAATSSTLQRECKPARFGRLACTPTSTPRARCEERLSCLQRLQSVPLKFVSFSDRATTARNFLLEDSRRPSVDPASCDFPSVFLRACGWQLPGLCANIKPLNNVFPSQPS